MWIQRKVIGRGTPGPIDVLSPQGEYLVRVATSMITYRSGATRGSAVSLPHTQGGGDNAAEKPVRHRAVTTKSGTSSSPRARQYTLPYRDVVRGEMILLAAEGRENKEIAELLDTPRPVVSKWRKRFFL